MGRTTEKFEIMVSVEPSEHPEDQKLLDDLRWALREAVKKVRAANPGHFIDTWNLEG